MALKSTGALSEADLAHLGRLSPVATATTNNLAFR